MSHRKFGTFYETMPTIFFTKFVRESIPNLKKLLPIIFYTHEVTDHKISTDTEQEISRI